MKYSKLLVLGLAAIISTNALAMPTQAEQTINQLNQQVQMLQQNNIIPKIDVNYIVKPAEEINKNRVEAMANLNVAEENCTVDINVTPDIKISYTGTHENREFLKEVTATSNQVQDGLRMSYITYHETAHCKLHEIKDPFRAEDKKAEAALNKFFKFSGSSYGSEHGDIGLYYMLHENFADTFAFMQLIKHHGVGKDVMETMQKIQIERSDAANSYNKNGLIAHNTEFSLKEVLKEENIRKIMATDSQEQLQEMALKIANKGMWTSIVTHGNVSQIVNQESLENGARFLLNNVISKSSNMEHTSEKNVNLNFEDNMLYKAALEAKDRMAKSVDFSSIKTQADMQKFQEEYNSGIESIIRGKVDKQLEESIKNGLDPLVAIEDYANTIKPEAKQSLEEIKTNGAEAVKNIDKLSEKLSKDTVLKNLNSIRQASYGSTNKVHIKYGS
jgi:hypothetical protein